MPRRKAPPPPDPPVTATRYCSCTDLRSIQVVDISPNGVFGYIQFAITCAHTLKDSPILIRGYNRIRRYMELYSDVLKKVKPRCGHKVLGGGRIKHDPENRTIHIFGSADIYPKADHALTAHIIKPFYPGYVITHGDEELLKEEELEVGWKD